MMVDGCVSPRARRTVPAMTPLTAPRPEEGKPLLASQIVRLRTEAGITQDELARRARNVGLSWTRAALASFESGTRDVGVEKFLGLLAAGGWSISDVFPEGVAVGIGDARSRTTDVVDFLAGRSTPAEFASSLSTPMKRTERRQRMVERDARGGVEKRAAAALGIDPEEVARLALERWGMSLTEERDHRLRWRLEDRRPNPKSEQAHRGRITRELLDELRDSIEGS